MDTKVRILLVDDHQLIRQGLHALLRNEPEFEVVGEASDGQHAVNMVREISPDVVVMDLQMPLLNGIEATRQIQAIDSNIKIICLSAHVDRHLAESVLKAGASGYVLKISAYERVTEAIQTVVQDKVYLAPEVSGHFVNGLSGDEGRENHTKGRLLSSREREVVQLMAEGLSTKQIAARLHISAKTVETHRRNLMDKLRIDSIAELTKYAVREGISSL